MKAARVIPVPERSLAETAYEKLKGEIFDFVLLPGDRFTETEIAQRLSMSRTPVREALYRLEREGYLTVHLRVGWSVRPYDFRQFEIELEIGLEQLHLDRWYLVVDGYWQNYQYC